MNFFEEKINDYPKQFLYPGDYRVSKQDICFSTILGSCISVCLFDPVMKQGGLNHFMLPYQTSNTKVLENETRYGSYAMELLINDLMKLGSIKKNLRAKIFGGANMFKSQRTEHLVGEKNIRFATHFLETENIKVIKKDCGGELGRKILFLPQKGKVYLKYLKKDQEREKIQKRETIYSQKIDSEIKKPPIILLF